MLVEAIKVGTRVRKQLGDIEALARDIEEVGLLQPIVVTPSGELIAGFRRLEAWKLTTFAKQPIPTHVLDIEVIVRGEYSENMQRKDFTPTEMVEIKRALEGSFKAAARERQRVGRGGRVEAKGAAMDHLAKFLGKDRKTIARAEAVVTAAEADPKKFLPIVKHMDSTGKVDGAFKAMNRVRQGHKWSAPAQPKATTFDQLILGEPIGDYSVPRLRNAVKRCEHALRVFRQLLDNVGVPCGQEQTLREFESEETVIHALKVAGNIE